MPPKSSPSTILFTVDVEDWFQVENFKPWITVDSWSARELRVEKNVYRLLELLDGNEATFFVLGWIAERKPEIVRLIADQGHEVASHGQNHRLNTEMPIDDLTKDLIDSRHRLEDLIGRPVSGYRAPSFSIDDRILQTIRRAGYQYDSSYNSFALNSRYGKLSGNKRFYPYDGLFEYAPDFFEIPLSNIKAGRFVIPWSGGGYFRLYPIDLFIAGIRHYLSHCSTFTFYMHPWEIDPAQPVVNEAGRLSKFRHYLNLDKTHSRVLRLLHAFDDCRFTSCRGHLQETISSRKHSSIPN
jgi:polysaccharide deacetylase family protein (PEP-CTERM system associated)